MLQTHTRIILNQYYTTATDIPSKELDNRLDYGT